MLYKYRKRNNNFATTGLVGEFRASSPPKKFDKTLLHRIQFIIKQRMVIQLHICYVCSGACSLGKY